MDKQNVADADTSMLLGNKKENTDPCYNMENLDNIMLSERSPSQKVTHYMSVFMWNVQNRWFHRNKQVD